MLNAVSAALEELIELQEKLIASADRKKTALIERQAEELNRLLKEEGKLVKQLEGTETERARLVEELLTEQPSLSFHEYVEGVPDEGLKKRLQFQLTTLQQLAIELQGKNQTNERLLKDSMSFVQHMIDQLTQSQKQQFNYQSPLAQPKAQASSRGFFDTKA